MEYLFLSFKVAADSSVHSLLQSGGALLERQSTRSYSDAVFVTCFPLKRKKKKPTGNQCVLIILKPVDAARTEQVTDSSRFFDSQAAVRHEALSPPTFINAGLEEFFPPHTSSCCHPPVCLCGDSLARLTSLDCSTFPRHSK